MKEKIRKFLIWVTKTKRETRLLPKGIYGKALWPWVFVRRGEKDNIELFNHELIHLRQQKEMLIVFAYVWYSTEFLFRFFAYKGDYKKAYYLHSMEREARENQEDFTYLKRREHFAFLLYL